jgi:hypothetical protein
MQRFVQAASFLAFSVAMCAVQFFSVPQAFALAQP